jgi:hypothetical protein
MGASADGLVVDGNDSGLIEIKCPYVLRNLRPTDIDKLSRQQRYLFCAKVNNNESVL